MPKILVAKITEQLLTMMTMMVMIMIIVVGTALKMSCERESTLDDEIYSEISFAAAVIDPLRSLSEQSVQRSSDFGPVQRARVVFPAILFYFLPPSKTWMEFRGTQISYHEE